MFHWIKRKSAALLRAQPENHTTLAELPGLCTSCQELQFSGDRAELEKAFARVFSSRDGKRVLVYLRHLVHGRSFDPEAGEGVLRHHDGQRWLLQVMERSIHRGLAGPDHHFLGKE